MRLKKEIRLLEIAKHNANSQLSSLKNQVGEQTTALVNYIKHCQQKRSELIVLYCQRKQLCFIVKSGI